MSKPRALRLTVEAANSLRQVRLRQVGSVAAVASSVAMVRMRNRLGLPRAVATVFAFGAAPALAAGFRRSRARDGLVWAAQMWAYKNAFEMPYDDELWLRERTHFDYPIALDAR